MILAYCVYLTIYYGNKMPMFYIGSSSLEKVKNGYRGTVSSKAYGKIWKSELKNNPQLFKTMIVSLHSSRKEAFDKEEIIQKKLNVIKNTLYLNKSYANSKFYLTQHSPWTRNKFKERIPWNKGKTNIYTDHTLHKMSSSKKGRPRGPTSDETKIKLSGPNPLKSNKGEKNGMYNKTHTDDVKSKLSLEATERFKGKSYEEMYGIEKANELKLIRSKNAKGKNSKGENNSRYDKNEYVFYNIDTGIIEKSTRYDFYTKYNINKGGVCGMINQGSTYKGWKIL